MTKKLILMSIILLMATVLISAALFPAVAEDTRYRIAVLPFDDGSIQHRWWGSNWDVGKNVADELVTELIKTQKFRLIDREQMDRILREQDFGFEGRVDPRTAAKIGKILGAQYFIMGKVTEFSTDSQGGSIGLRGGYGLRIKNNTARVTIVARLVDTSTAEIVTSVTGKGEKSQTNVGLAVKWNAIAIGSNEFYKTNLGIALRDAVTSVAQQLSDQAYPDGGNNAPVSGIEGLVADTYGNKVYITAGTRDGVKPGMIFEVHHILRVVKDPSTNEVIDYVTEPVATISVTDVKEKSATCVIVSRLSSKYSITAKDLVKQRM